MEKIRLNGFKKTKDGKYLKNYELYYTNKAGRDKTFEIVSYSDITDISLIGNRLGGVVIVGFKDDKLLLLKEFRMGVNRFVYNMCAGRLEPDETIEVCARRELYEETGLELTRIIDILPPAYGAVALSDAANQLIIAEVSGELSSHSEEDELIIPGFYTREETAELVETECFSGRAQFVAYSFAKGFMPHKEIK